MLVVGQVARWSRVNKSLGHQKPFEHSSTVFNKAVGVTEMEQVELKAAQSGVPNSISPSFSEQTTRDQSPFRSFFLLTNLSIIRIKRGKRVGISEKNVNVYVSLSKHVKEGLTFILNSMFHLTLQAPHIPPHSLFLY